MRSGKQIIRAAVATLLLATAIASCDVPIVYSHYEHTPLAGWERNDTLVFCVPPVREPGRFNEEIGMRIVDSYPFTSISLIVEQRVFPGYRSRRDTIRCTLVDDNGFYKGPGVDLHQSTFPLGYIDLKRGDSLCIKVRHVMKREMLPGISDVGITLTAAQERVHDN